ncbi:MAG: transposase [Allobaculum sp.]|nr:transposase [Allobaculum sp.]
MQEQSLFQFRRILSYKCKFASIELKIANQWYPSSKKCSQCGNLKKGLKLSHRTYHCEACGFTIDRDENAAINLKNCDQFEVLNLKKISQF